MNRLLSMLLATALICVLFVPTQISAQASISIDHVDSLYNGKIQPDQPLKFHILWTNNTGGNIPVQTTGYSVYLSNNALITDGLFEIPTVELMPINFSMLFDLHFGVNEFTDGVGVDTIGVGGAQLAGGGLPMGFDGLVFNISTSVSSDFAGDSLCIDSTFFGVSGAWLWATSGGTIPPDWGGPYCYEILPSCCIGFRGNFNNSPDDQVDIADFWGLISYVFLLGEAPTCYAEADLDASGFVDVSDVIRYIQFMHIPIVFPEDCE